jgi:hypothetical protein
MEWACKFQTPAFILFWITGLVATFLAEIYYARIAYTQCKHKSNFKTFRQFLWAFGHHSGMVRKVLFYNAPSIHPDDIEVVEEYAGRARLVFWIFLGLFLILFIATNACK